MDGGNNGDEAQEMGEEGENEEMEDIEVVKEAEPEEFYDKSKSFFDSISYENPGSSGSHRINWNRERENSIQRHLE